MSNFYTDTIMKDSRFKTTNIVKDQALLEPYFRRKLLACQADLLGHGVKTVIFETYRSQARQSLLHAQGKSQIGTVGVHHFGLAADLVRLDAHNNPTWDDSQYSLWPKVCKAHGLIWGGDWGHPQKPTSFPDMVHIQRCSMKDQAALLAGKWYPAYDYDPTV